MDRRLVGVFGCERPWAGGNLVGTSCEEVVMGIWVEGGHGELRTEINATPLIDVLLVLLIVFLTIMPLMMKMETLEIPGEPGCGYTADRPLIVSVLASGDVVIDDHRTERVVPRDQMLLAIRARVDAMRDKVVYVDFEDAVAWDEVVQTMDTIRSLAADVHHDEVKVALKLRTD